MTKDQEESWIENGLIDSLRIRWIIRNRTEGGKVFVAQFEYTNKPKNRNTILRWDGAHGNYHIDIYDSKGKQVEKRNRRHTLPSLDEQISIAFNDLEKNLPKILEKRSHLALLRRITNNPEPFQSRLAEVKKHIISQASGSEGLKLGTRHVGQTIRTKAKIRDSIEVKLYDSKGNLREKRKQ